MQVNILEAKTQFSQLVDRALKGEEVVIARHGKPLLRLVPVRSAGTRPIGLNAGTLSEEEAAESLRPLGEAELEGWDGD
jgi:prevent-host-death family protein